MGLGEKLPAQLGTSRKVGASQKNDGPVSDDIRFNVTFHQTRWSDEEDGRVVRVEREGVHHDLRADPAETKNLAASQAAIVARALGNPLPRAKVAQPKSVTRAIRPSMTSPTRWQAKKSS